MLVPHKIGKYIMSLLPDKNLFIVTSAIHANIGVVNMQERVLQTIDTLENLKKKVPDALVLLVDGSPHNIDDDIKKKISEYCQAIWFNTHPDIYAMASSGRKSEAEIILLFNTLLQIKQSNVLSSVKRIFKYSARTVLEDDFDISAYDNLFGKYVFKKAIPSWMDENRKRNVTDHLYITRMYSFCPSLIDNYLQTLQPILNNVITHGIDTEHSHYLCIDKRYVIEHDNLHCAGIVAGSGQTERY
jgi:hypothetical protein